MEWRDRKYELPAPFFSATPESPRLLASCIKRGPKVYTGAAVSVPRKAYQAADMLMAAVLPPPGPYPVTSSRYIAPQPWHDGGGWTLVKVVVVQPSFTIGNVCSVHARAIKNPRRDSLRIESSADRQNVRTGLVLLLFMYLCISFNIFLRFISHSLKPFPSIPLSKPSTR